MARLRITAIPILLLVALDYLVATGHRDGGDGARVRSVQGPVDRDDDLVLVTDAWRPPLCELGLTVARECLDGSRSAADLGK